MVWIPEEIKEEFKEVIPDEIYDRIVTEKETRDVNELKELLEEKNHPIITRWVDVSDNLIRETINFIKEKGGKVEPKEASEALGLNEVQFRRVIDEMKDRGILGGEPGGYLDGLNYRWLRGDVCEWPWS
ncbi:hypothetical protein AKJ40_03750 [candidate division MSBL1 archaeon SCGC-AAA259M10]|uniref:Uncharacterized protein n=1 Tax=candidate division MSBL1 archaeon SCGC-AAA259M10 TaxID=1698270 RepID=A0A133UYD8_9EURY|nr:hypothetical protein AKJ40_03750 [candidate division MSBL1 archaeon SCGC-AAA259M10]